jgi:hypothetical protein
MDNVPWLLPKERGIGDGDVRGKQKEKKETKEEGSETSYMEKMPCT